MKRRFWPLASVLTLVMLGGLASDGLAASRHKQAAHTKQAKKADAAHGAKLHKKTARKGGKRSRLAAAKHKSKQAAAKAQPPAPPVPSLTGDLALIKEAIDQARKGKTADATTTAKTISDPAGQTLVEWFILRNPDADTGFGRYAAFIAANPGWPGIVGMRKRAEARLWQDRADPATVHGFTNDQPLSSKGRFALARAMLAEGNRVDAAREVRMAWRSDELSERTESDALEAFRSLLTANDHRARMNKRIGAKDLSAAARAARQLGSDDVAIVKACVGGGNDKKTDALFDAVATSARQDLGYVLCRANWLMRQNKIAEATRLIIAAPQETMAAQETDEWWRVRRLLARKLLDLNQFQSAYDVVKTAALPASANYQAEFHFMSGWIALRYLNDALTARIHFARIDDGSADPIVLARANYWRGRAAEALGDSAAMWTSYEAAARHTTAYYGQLARLKLGVDSLELRTRPQPEQAHDAALTTELVRAAEMLYAIGERDLVVSFVASLADQTRDAAMLAAVGDLAGRNNDARAMLEIGKIALVRGLAMDLCAFPTIGIPKHNPIAPDIGLSMTYAVARTESAFNQRDRSPANAVGLMQVTPEAARDTAKRFGVTYDWDRMVSDPVYNTQMGAAELSALVKEYRGSHIMVFAGYNAGRGRVREWVKAHGDPRDPNVDPVDWVERIPISETRNYVQRVMENFLVYQVRFEAAGTAVSSLGPRQGTPQDGKPASLAAAQPSVSP